MINVVLDTNILVSALITPGGNPAKVLKMVFHGYIMPIYNDNILAEYTNVLYRDKFKIYRNDVPQVIAAMKTGTFLSVSASTRSLPDEDDRVFYDTAAAASAYLVTGNMKHYPDEPFILTPAAFLSIS